MKTIKDLNKKTFFKDIFFIVILYIIVLLFSNLIFYSLFYILLVKQGIPINQINQNLNQTSILFISMLITWVFINNFIFSAIFFKIKKSKLLSKNYKNKIKNLSYLEILTNTYKYSVIYITIYGIIFMIILIWLIKFFKFITTLKGIFITLNITVILLILWASKTYIFKLIEKLFEGLEILILGLEKGKSSIGLIFRFIIIVSITYGLIMLVDMRNIFNIPLSNLTLKDIGKILLNIGILYYFIYLGLLNQPSFKQKKAGFIPEEVDGNIWFDIGIIILIFGGLAYFYFINK